MKLTVSIVNWNVRDYLEKCLDSIFRYGQGISLEVVVVDNASTDGSVAMLKGKFPQVAVIESKENVGYGRAHNLALPKAKGDFILFLNPDTEMLPETLSKMLAFMDVYPDAGAAMCREIEDIRQKNEAPQVGVLLKGPRRLFWHLSQQVERLWPNPVTKRYIVDRIVEARVRYSKGYFFIKCAYLEGGFLLVRRKALANISGFDPRFFFGGEGVELTRQIKKNGWSLYLVFSIYCIHHGNKSSEQLSAEQVRELEEKWEARKSRD